jgi:lambda family phage tail tape measure protein
MAQNVARLGVVLGLDTAEFVKGLGTASAKLDKFVEKAKSATLVAAVAMTALAAKTIAYADEVSDLADANDVTIATVMALGTALAVSGGKAENAGKLLSSLSSQIDSAAQGNEQSIKSFERVGVSLQDIASMSNEQLLDKITKSLAGMGDAITRNAIAQDIFSKAGKNIGWANMVEQIEKARAKYVEYEDGMRALGDVADKVALMSKGAMGNMAKAIGEDLNTLIDYIETLTEKSRIFGVISSAVFGAITTTFETLAVLGSEVAFVFEQIGGAVGTLAKTSFTSLQTNIDQWKEYNKQARASREELDAFQKKILNNEPKEKKETKDNSEQKRIIEMTQKNKDMLRTAQQISEEYNRQQVVQVQQLALQGLMLGMTENERKEQEAVNRVIQSTSQEIEKITKAKMDAAGRDASAQVLAEYDKQIAKVYELQEVFITMSREVAVSQIETQRTFSFGWDKSFNQFAENAYNYARVGEEMFMSITGNMTTALDNFVQTGKFSFADFTKSIIQDLIKIQLRMQMMKLFSMAVNGLGGMMGGGGGVGGGVGGAFADGGEPPVGVPSLVGERGPELFIPSRPGTIIPNHQLGNMMGGGGTTINGPYIASMNAIDTQSGIQFLAKNKMTIWSMNQSANRSIPAGR